MKRLVIIGALCAMANAATLNVQNFGATGNGSTNDTSAVQSALDACASGDTVFFPTGTYSVTLLNLPVGCNLNGTRALSILKARTAGMESIIFATQSQNSTIENLVFDMNSLSGSAIKLDWEARGVIIRYNVIKNGGSPGAIFLPSGTNSSTRDTSIDHNIFQDINQGIYSYNFFNNSHIDWNYFTTFHQGISGGGCQPLPGTGINTTIDHNTFILGRRMAIEICGRSNNLSVSYNFLQNWRPAQFGACTPQQILDGDNFLGLCEYWGPCFGSNPYMCDSMGISIATGGYGTTVSHNRIYRQFGTSWGIEYTVSTPPISRADDNIIKEAGIPIVDEACANLGIPGNCTATRQYITNNYACGGAFVSASQAAWANYPSASNFYYTSCSNPSMPAEDATPSMPFSLSGVANQPPTITLDTPAPLANYTLGVSGVVISLSATAADPDGSLSKVEFFRDGALLATVTTAPYSYLWTATVPGTFVLTARATDNSNAATTTAGTTITVAPAPLTGTTNPRTAVFPTALATDDTLTVMANAARTVLATALTNSTTALTFNVATGTRFRAPSYITVDNEVMKLCSISTNTFTICPGGRAVHGGIANHAVGAAVVAYIDENLFNQSFAEIKALQQFIGADGNNIVTKARNFQFSADAVYDIGAAAAGRPRDLYVGRDVYLGGNATIGGFTIQGTVTTTSATTHLLTQNTNGLVVRSTASTDVAVSVLAGLGPVYTISFVQAGTGRIIFTAGGGMTLSNPHSFTRTTGVGAVATVFCTALNSCVLAGDLEP